MRIDLRPAYSAKRKVLGAAFVAITTMAASPAHARLDIWDLELGATIEEMPPFLEFKGYACGSNGGPPLHPLTGWSEFAKCAPEPSGLHEVYFEYDDENEYIARALEDIRLARDVGTVDKSFPIIASALFSDQGVLAGVRVVTDPRPDQQTDNEWAGLRVREEHHLLGAFLAGQFSIVKQTDCVEIAPSEGESAISGQLLKQNCERVDPEEKRRYVVQQRYFRKRGQSGIDPHTGALTSGQFESTTRAEIYLAE